MGPMIVSSTAGSLYAHTYMYTTCTHTYVHAHTHTHRILAAGPNKLLVAAASGDHKAIRRLVEEEGISPSQVFQHGITALHEACEGGYVEAVQVLLSLGAAVDKQVHLLVI